MLNEDVENVAKILSELEPLEGIQEEEGDNGKKIMVRFPCMQDWAL